MEKNTVPIPNLPDPTPAARLRIAWEGDGVLTGRKDLPPFPRAPGLSAKRHRGRRLSLAHWNESHGKKKTVPFSSSRLKFPELRFEIPGNCAENDSSERLRPFSEGVADEIISVPFPCESHLVEKNTVPIPNPAPAARLRSAWEGDGVLTGRKDLRPLPRAPGLSAKRHRGRRLSLAHWNESHGKKKTVPFSSSRLKFPELRFEIPGNCAENDSSERLRPFSEGVADEIISLPFPCESRLVEKNTVPFSSPPSLSQSHGLSAKCHRGRRLSPSRRLDSSSKSFASRFPARARRTAPLEDSVHFPKEPLTRSSPSPSQANRALWKRTLSPSRIRLLMLALGATGKGTEY